MPRLRLDICILARPGRTARHSPARSVGQSYIETIDLDAVRDGPTGMF